jgi:micrococcal nuclease
MNLRRRTTIVALHALAVAIIASACGGGFTGPGSASPAPVPGAPGRPTGPTQDATLVRVVDGDTIRVMVGGVEERVRYIGIDTPERNASSPATPDPYAEAATDANVLLLAGGRLVLETDVSERDQYGRLLRDVWTERGGAWTLVNLALVAEGYAQVSTYPPDVKYVDVLLAAQRAAREEQRGLWGGSLP